MVVFCLTTSISLRKIITFPSNLACILRYHDYNDTIALSAVKEGSLQGNGSTEFKIVFNGGLPSCVFLTLQLKFCCDAEGNLSLIPRMRKGTRSSMESSAESPSFPLSSLCTVLVFYVKWLLDKSVLHEDRVLSSKENGAESGRTSFSCV